MVLGYMFRPHCSILSEPIFIDAYFAYLRVYVITRLILPSYLIFKCDLNQDCDIFYFPEYVFNRGFYLTYIMIVHTMGPHIVRTLMALNLYKLT